MFNYMNQGYLMVQKTSTKKYHVFRDYERGKSFVTLLDMANMVANKTRDDGEYLVREAIAKYKGYVLPHAKNQYVFTKEEDAQNLIDNFLNPLVIAKKLIGE